ncbi:aminoglycoside phosphotransferase family protein [Streptomyces sp. NPDC048290]|uniref:aminoglycoside phosphotransferase family protein n=1 Tax=Streptomyces sp. NPDC048290 TaxID=3155811 RepID=UPI003416F125
MTQASIPTEDTVRRIVRGLLKDPSDSSDSSGTSGTSGTPGRSGGFAGGPDIRPASPGGATWWVGARHVLRLAPGPEAGGGRRRELRVRDLVRPHLPVAVPVSVAHGEWAPGLGYTLDTVVPGGSADRHDVSAVGEADLAGVLTGLRQVPARQAEALGVPRRAPRSLEALRQAAARAAERLAAADESDDSGPARVHQLTPAAAAQLGAQSAAAVLVHHALTADHLVVSADGRVRGVLGWDAAVLGDPAEDIAGLAAAVGSPAAVRAATLAGYGARPCLRGLWLARCDAVRDLAAALGTRADLPPLRDRLHRTWEPILLERVTDLRADAPVDDGP